MSITKEDYAAWVRQYFNHPVAFVREVLNVEPDVWQCEVMDAVAMGERNIAIASGHRVGKSTVLGWICLWYMMTREPFKIGVTAPTSGQLEDAMFAELKTWLQKMEANAPGLAGILEAKSDRVDLVASNGTSFLVIKTGRVEQPEALAGLHSANTLLIGDEASGIPDVVFDASTSSMAAPNAQMLLCGNPLRATGYFAKCFAEWTETWRTFTVSSVDCPRVSRAWIEEKKVEYGEESNQYRARVLGLFPLGDDDTIIPMDWVLGAIGREVLVLPNEPEIWGLDVAEKGSNVSALARRRGKKVTSIEIFSGIEVMQLVGRVHAIWQSLPEKARPVELNVDGIGYGAGVAGRLDQLLSGTVVNSVNVAETPSIAGEKVYFNRRTECWYLLRQWFQGRDCSIPNDERLKSDLTKIRVDNTEGRKDTLKAESKKAMKKRGVKSPDTGDAVMLTFAGDGTAARPNSGFSRHRNKPIRRNVKGTSYT